MLNEENFRCQIRRLSWKTAEDQFFEKCTNTTSASCTTNLPPTIKPTETSTTQPVMCLQNFTGDQSGQAQEFYNQDDYCIYKYSWFGLNPNMYSPEDYNKVYGYEPPATYPEQNDGGVLVYFDPSCEAYFATNVILIQHCVEWCEHNCVNITERNIRNTTEYPFTNISSCGPVGLACEDTIYCTCANASGIPCSMKETSQKLPTVKEVLDQHNAACMNSYYNKTGVCTWGELVSSSSTSDGAVACNSTAF